MSSCDCRVHGSRIGLIFGCWYQLCIRIIWLIVKVWSCQATIFFSAREKKGQQSRSEKNLLNLGVHPPVKSRIWYIGDRSKKGLGDLDKVTSYFPAIPRLLYLAVRRSMRSFVVKTVTTIGCISGSTQKSIGRSCGAMYQFRHGLWSKMTPRGFFIYGGSLSFEIPRTTCKWLRIIPTCSLRNLSGAVLAR